MVRFRIKGLHEKVSHHELLEALTENAAIEDVKIDKRSMRPNGDGTQSCEFEVPPDEASMLRGPMREAKFFLDSIRTTVVITFEEVGAGGGSSGSQSRVPPQTASASSGGGRHQESAPSASGSRTPGALAPPAAAQALGSTFLRQKQAASPRPRTFGDSDSDSDREKAPDPRKQMASLKEAASRHDHGESSAEYGRKPGAQQYRRGQAADEDIAGLGHFIGDEDYSRSAGHGAPAPMETELPSEPRRNGRRAAPVPRFDDRPLPHFDEPREKKQGRGSDLSEDRWDTRGRASLGGGQQRRSLEPEEDGWASRGATQHRHLEDDRSGGYHDNGRSSFPAPSQVKNLEPTWGPADMAYCTRFLGGEANGPGGPAPSTYDGKSLRDSCTTPCSVQ